jgi:hypothetical protein
VPAPGRGYGASFLHAKLQNWTRVESSRRNPHQELVSYLTSELEVGIDGPIKWWGVSVTASAKSMYVYD